MADFRAPLPNFQPIDEQSSVEELVKFARDVNAWAAQMREQFDLLSKYVP